MKCAGAWIKSTQALQPFVWLACVGLLIYLWPNCSFTQSSTHSVVFVIYKIKEENMKTSWKWELLRCFDIKSNKFQFRWFYSFLQTKWVKLIYLWKVKLNKIEILMTFLFWLFQAERKTFSVAKWNRVTVHFVQSEFWLELGVSSEVFSLPLRLHFVKMLGKFSVARCS